jgi:hypothetical protein
MLHERKEQMRQKCLKEPPRWIIGTILNDLNLSEWSDVDDLHERHETTLTY